MRKKDDHPIRVGVVFVLTGFRTDRTFPENSAGHLHDLIKPTSAIGAGFRLRFLYRVSSACASGVQSR